MHSGPMVRPPAKEIRKIWRVFSLRSPSYHGDLNILPELNDDSKQSLLTEKKVPKGFIAVYVGPDTRRYVIPASYLSLEDFRVLMERAAEEFGFQQEGGLRFPCEEHDFEEILVKCFAKQNKKKKREIRVGGS